MPRHHREEWWLQSHGLHNMQGRVLLAVPRSMGATWIKLVSAQLYLSLAHIITVILSLSPLPLSFLSRYKCNRYNEKDSQNARDTLAVSIL